MLTVLSALVIAGALQVAGNVDTRQSSFEFTVNKRIGAPVRGHFDQSSGVLRVRGDGERQVTIVLESDSVVVGDNPIHTQFAKSSGMFSAAAHPSVTFQSDWHDAKVLYSGGSVTGILTIRGVSRPATLRISPASCANPGFGCAVQAKGQINREQFGMSSLGGLLRPDVELSMTVVFDPAGS